MIRIQHVGLALALALPFSIGCLPELPKDKALTRFVYDEGNTLTPAQRTTLDSLLRAYEQRTTNEIVVFTSADTTSGIDTIFRNEVQRLNDTLGVGKLFKRNGLVLGFSDRLHEVYTLSQQAMAPDTAQTMALTDSVILPLISDRRIYDALLAGTHAFMDMADSLSAQKQRRRAARKAKD